MKDGKAPGPGSILVELLQRSFGGEFLMLRIWRLICSCCRLNKDLKEWKTSHVILLFKRKAIEKTKSVAEDKVLLTHLVDC